MDDLLVIILTLIVAVIGTLGQIKKKKRPVNTTSNAEENDSNNFWSLVEDQFYDKQPDPEKQEEIINADAPEEIKITVDEKKPFDQFKSVSESTSVPRKNLLGGIKDEKPKMNKKLKDFSLRKAVIYSEILNRKYQ